MKIVNINLKNTVQSNYCIDTTDGDRIYVILKKSLKDGDTVNLSFEGIELVIAAFLNVAVGQLFKDFEIDYINSHLSAEHLHNDFQHLWDKVIVHAPHYYANQEVMDQCISKIIEE